MNRPNLKLLIALSDKAINQACEVLEIAISDISATNRRNISDSDAPGRKIYDAAAMEFGNGCVTMPRGLTTSLCIAAALSWPQRKYSRIALTVCLI